MIFLVNPELFALIIPLAVSGGISLLVLLLIAALVIFLVNPELFALIIPLAVSGGISLLVGFLWNTIKSCLCRQNPEEISTEQLTETNEYNPNKITDLSDLNNNLSLENNQKNENGQEKTDQ